MKSIQFSVIIDGVTKKKDGTLSLKLGTQELPPEDTAMIFELGNKQVWCALAETALTEDNLDIPETMMEFKTDKSPSERLRNSLYVYWEAKRKDITWDIFYRQQMEKFIEHVKEKID